MELNSKDQLDLLERRRRQNRMAQRRFRERKRLALKDASLDENNTTCQQPSSMESEARNNEVTTSIIPLAEDLVISDEPECEEAHFDMDMDIGSIDQFLYQTDNNNSISLPSLDPPILQPQLEYSNLILWNAPESNTANNASSSQLQDSHTQPHPRTSESDMPASMPANMTPTSGNNTNNNEFSRLITTSKKKGWIGGLHIAAQQGHKQIVQALLRGDMDVNQQDSDGRTPLIHAVIEGHASVVRLLLAQGARVGISECDDRSAIHWAVLRRNAGILSLLLDHRLEHEPDLAIDSYDRTGWTPLHMAIVRGFEPGLVLLLQSGADINAKAHKCPFAGNVTGFLDRDDP